MSGGINNCAVQPDSSFRAERLILFSSQESQPSLSYLSSDDRLVGVKCTSHTVDMAPDWKNHRAGGGGGWMVDGGEERREGSDVKHVFTRCQKR